ncbi:uncharacterized protein LOC122093529 [Macadamia integrifolia]|uniref:uncharacterized protein LOC122093529 n=1 Tax=Macadamia integrifolia TaxID=60698 RepID=UPI001C5325A9|nr:uncharacterized protein LOC122093529 [Macadamia integrifolia]XP_042519813.1 uncharacterized protein LOC122093529 [Macadamia integrifolia]XP_042519814.1 uncharacterized protein LOC122093529 [Macadamia integrifolia]
MAGRYNFLNTGSVGRSIRDEDFEEEDVWSVTVDINKSTAKIRKPTQDKSSVSSTPTVRRLPTASRMIPRANNSSESQEVKVMQQSSAPVNIPDWSKIYRKNPRKEADDSYIGGFGGASVRYGGGFSGIIGDDDDDDDDDVIPPHEWISKKLAMSQISSFSVCEGVGRTLKGRDLSKVRDAVLTRTGFIE